MPDREEIAEKLKDAAEVLECVRDEQSERSYEYYNGLVKAVDAAIGIVRASKTQQEGMNPDGDNCWNCGYTVKRLRYVGPDKDLCVDLFSYCPMCGRKVKWDDN